MRFLRRISLPVHGVVELTVGLALVAAAMLLSLGAAGMILTFTAGVVLAGVGLGALDSLSLAAHQSLDRLLTVLLALASVAVALWGDPMAALVLLAGAAGMLILTAATKWTRTPLHHRGI